MKTRVSRTLFLPLLFVSSIAYAYPNGTLQYLTDTGPFCASCHSAVKTEYMPELPPDAAARETPENKHYGLIKMPAQPSPYLELTQEQKDKLINEAKRIDSSSSVKISAPASVKAGGEIKVTVNAKGGNGPVICIMLVDRALRFQSRPISSDGWTITGEPEVKGQGGKAQTAWLDRRARGLKRNLNYVAIENQAFDPEKGVYPEGTVIYTLKAPAQTGAFTVCAAFLYGTENADSAAFFQRPSGRILFSEELKITVE